MTEEDDINAGTVEGIVEAEKLEAKKLSKTQRQKRRRDLSDPSAISARLSSLLAERIPPETIIAKIKELMAAKIETKGGNIREDTRTQEAAVKLWMDYVVGRPAQRVETVTVNVDTSIEDLQEQVQMSPALRARLIKMAGGAS